MNKRVRNVLQKRAGAVSDAAKQIPASLGIALLTTPVGAPVSAGAGIGAAAIGQFQDEENKQAAARKLINQTNNKEEGLAWLPGYGSFKLGRRQALINQVLQDEKKNSDHDATSRAAYNMLKWLNPLNIAATPIAGLVALLKDRRTLKEQQELANDEYYGLKSMLIPGWNSYQQWKTIGASDHLGSEDGLRRLTSEDLSVLDPEVRETVLAMREAKRKEK